jgi:hypothetical protein
VELYSQIFRILGFGPSIIHWFETFFHNSESCVLNNEHLSKRFKIERGGRQKPLYPLIYLFCQSNYLLTVDSVSYHDKNQTKSVGLVQGGLHGNSLKINLFSQ